MDSEWLLGPPVLMGDRVAWLGPEEPLMATVRWLGRLPEVFPHQMVAGISLVTFYVIMILLSVRVMRQPFISSSNMYFSVCLLASKPVLQKICTVTFGKTIQQEQLLTFVHLQEMQNCYFLCFIRYVNVIIFRMSHKYWERRMEPLGTESYFSVIKTMGSSYQSLKLSRRRNFSASSQVTLTNCDANVNF